MSPNGRETGPLQWTDRAAVASKDVATRFERKRSERFCPNDLVSLDSEFGQLNPAKSRSGPGPHVLATWVRKVSSARDVRNFSDP